jgi:DNA polymerase III delta prime subunit
MNAPEPAPNSSDLPSLEQNVTGDRNQVIGQMLGGIVINQLTIHDRIPAAAAPPPIAVTPPLNQQEYRHRQVLLNKVKEYWIKGVLETSLHTRVLIELGLRSRPDLVQRPFQEVAEFPEISGQPVAEDVSATTIFEQMGAGRTLLILGEPGSGKTIALLKLAEDLLARTEQDLSQSMPVVFNLSSWAKKPQSIEAWLVQELLEKYQVSKALGNQWVENESLILLLDGLDEVKAEQHNACVQALNQFMQTHGTTELVICCRIQDYQALADRLILRSAICIQPLTSEQIDQYFEQAGKQLESLKEVLRQDAELQGLATSPLMLSIMSLAYQGSKLPDIIKGGTPEDYRQRLFDTYINRMFQRRGTTQLYCRQKTQHWLIWLSQRMNNAAQTVFLIERLQPSWLLTRGQHIRYRLFSGLVNGLLFGLIYELIVGLTLGWFGAPIIAIGVYALLVGGPVGLVTVLSSSIQPVETLKWSWKAAKNSFLVGPIIGLSDGLIVGLVVGLSDELLEGGLLTGLTNGLIYGLAVGLCAGLILGLIGGFRGSEIQQRGNPNQGIRQSAQNAVMLGILSGLISWLISGVILWGLSYEFKREELVYGLLNGVSYGLIGGVVGGLMGGGSACSRHFALRLMLYRLGFSPWNYARFLDYATDRLFLQKVGGGYIFVHRMLLEHFAAMPLEQEKH